MILDIFEYKNYGTTEKKTRFRIKNRRILESENNLKMLLN
jgi:hypothetical protein